MLINLTITSQLTGEVIEHHEAMDADDAIALIEMRQQDEALRDLYNEVESAYWLTEEEKAQKLPGMNELLEAERHNLDAVDNFAWTPSAEEAAQEEAIRQHVEANHDRLVNEWEKYSWLLPE